MKRLNPEKLNVEYGLGITPTSPFIPRRYTLTHSDVTAELFLTIGLLFAYDKIGPLRDEVLSEWRINHDNLPYMFVYLNVDGSGSGDPAIRNLIFRRELPLALEAIRFGDRHFFNAYPSLDYTPIWVYFDSAQPTLNSFEFWGYTAEYKVKEF